MDTQGSAADRLPDALDQRGKRSLRYGGADDDHEAGDPGRGMVDLEQCWPPGALRTPGDRRAANPRLPGTQHMISAPETIERAGEMVSAVERVMSTVAS